MLNEGVYTGEFLISEGNGTISREEVTVTQAGTALASGTVLAKHTAGAATVAAKAGGNAASTGALTLDATTPVIAGAKAGVYTVRCITAAVNGGVFRVDDPDGRVLGDVAVGATWAEQVKFVIADGTQDFIVGEGFDITIAAGSGKFVPYDDAALNGAGGAAAAVLYTTLPAATGDTAAVVIARDAEVVEAKLVGIDAAGKADLAALGIICR